MRISDWSSDVCSSDLQRRRAGAGGARLHQREGARHRAAHRPARERGRRARRSRSSGVVKGRIAALGIVASVALLGACGDDSSDDTGDGGALDQGSTPASLVEGVEVGVSAIDNNFRPEEIEIEAGTEVGWTNDGGKDHTALTVEGDE